MRLIRAHIRNFKLLEDVRLDFSTDNLKPLTVIRAENGSGKTSILHALRWAFYGMNGLPSNASKLRLASSASPTGTPVEVSVMMEFDHVDSVGERGRYRLIRTVVETPTDSDRVDRQDERVRLLRLTDRGEDALSEPEAWVARFIPARLQDVFFTDGDSVQTFISGQVSSQQRQEQVHRAIKALLGLERLQIAVDDVEAAHRRLRAEAAQSGGASTTALEQALEQTDNERTALRATASEVSERLANMSQQKEAWERELTALRGIGDLDDLNQRIAQTEADQKNLETSRARSLTRMRDLFRSEVCSWSIMGPKLRSGNAAIAELADRHIIPGLSVEVLTDRLELGRCICGESLEEGTEHRAAVEALRASQAQVSENRQRLTQLLHSARQSALAEDARIDTGKDFLSERTALLVEFTQTRDALASKGAELERLRALRQQIPEPKVRQLTDNLANVQAKITDELTRAGELKARIEILEERRQQQSTELTQAERNAAVAGDLAAKRDVAADLHGLATGVLDVLEHEYVAHVSDQMHQRFMEIVGSHPDFEAQVFSGVHIDDRFNIVVDTGEGRTLDTDFELNGASQRALTLSFIWALMEVSNTTAPRIIDTPVGMVSGGVKSRMVDSITRPPGEGHPDFQVVLLLTRSEIRDIEETLDARAGVTRTLSCSHHYPEDLVYQWGVDHPVSRLCNCSHRQSCRICARKYDARYGLEFRDMEAASNA